MEIPNDLEKLRKDIERLNYLVEDIYYRLMRRGLINCSDMAKVLNIAYYRVVEEAERRGIK